MNHKEKAKELMDAMYAWNQAESKKVAAKECALIAANLLIENTTNCMECGGSTFNKDDWQKVKQIIKGK